MKQPLNEQLRRMQKLAGLLNEERIIQVVSPFDGGGPGYGEEYRQLQVYEKGDNVIFKVGDAGFDGVPETVYVMPNKNIYHAIDILDKEGFPVEDDVIEYEDDWEAESAILDLTKKLEEIGEVFKFNPETDIKTQEDIDRYNSYLLDDDDKYDSESFGDRF